MTRDCNACGAPHPAFGHPLPASGARATITPLPSARGEEPALSDAKRSRTVARRAYEVYSMCARRHPHGCYVRVLHALAVPAVAAVDLLDVGLSFREGRHAAESLDIGRAGVVRGQGDALVVEAVEQIAEVLRPGGDVLLRVERVGDSQGAGRVRNDLHQSLRALVRYELGPEVRFRMDHRRDQLRRQVVLARLAIDDRAVRNVRAEVLLFEDIQRESAGWREELLAHGLGGEDRQDRGLL